MAYTDSTTNTGSGTSASGNKPTTATGQLLIAFIGGGTGQIPTLSGWTLISRVSGASADPAAGLFYRVVDGSEPASWTWTLPSYADWIVQITSHSAIDTASPIHAQSSAWTRDYGTTTTASITTTITSTIIQVAVIQNQTGGYTWNAALTEREDQQGYYILGGMADRVDAPSGTYNYTATATASAQWHRTFMVALKPASGGSAPNAPTGLTATPASATQINLSWTDTASDETGFTVERSAAGAGSWSVLSSTVAANATSYNDTTASANTAYDYRVKATNGSGSSSYATASGARTYPGTPTGLGATAAGSTQIDLSWTAPSGGATSYKIERSPTGSGSWTEIATGVTGTTYSSTGLSATTTYYYRVRATNAAGDGAYSTTASATTSGGGGSVPGQVTGLSATPVSATQINLSWSAPSGASTYKVERSPNGSTGWTEIASGIATTSYSSTGLTAATTYYYRVRATNATGDGSYSATANATTSGGAPAAPTGVTATTQNSSTIRVAWTASGGATSYTIERSPNGSTGWNTIATEVAASPYDDTGLAPSTTYHYRVTAVNASGSSAASATASATTSSAGSSIAYPSGATWQWTEADWQYIERIGLVSITATAGVGYVGLSQDGTTYDWFAGPLVAGRLTYIGTGAVGSAAETSAKTAALTLPTVAGGLWEIPPVYRARYVRLGHRNTGATYSLKEFFPRRLVEADDMRAEFLKARHIAAGTIIADHLFGTTLAALKAELGIVTLGTGGGLWQGTGTFAAPTTGLKIWNEAGIGRLSTYSGGVEQVGITTGGVLTFGGGRGRFDSNWMSWRSPHSSPGVYYALKFLREDTGAEIGALGSGAGAGLGSRIRFDAYPTGPSNIAEIVIEAGDAEILIRQDSSGGQVTLTNTGLKVGAGSGTPLDGQIACAGALAMLLFGDRTLTPRWGWYASAGVARLWHESTGDRISVDSAANLSVGGTVTAAQFHVSGQHLLTSSGTAFHAGNVGIRTAVDAAIAVTINGATAGTTQFGLAVRDNANVNNLYVRNDGYVYTRGTIDVGGLNNRSDARLKAGITPIPDALRVLRAIPARQWAWRADPTGRVHYGPIAQDVERVAPELVSEAAPGPGETRRDGERGTLSLDQGSLVGLLHGAIQQLAARIEALEGRSQRAA